MVRILPPRLGKIPIIILNDTVHSKIFTQLFINKFPQSRMVEMLIYLHFYQSHCNRRNFLIFYTKNSLVRGLFNVLVDSTAIKILLLLSPLLPTTLFTKTPNNDSVLSLLDAILCLLNNVSSEEIFFISVFSRLSRALFRYLEPLSLFFSLLLKG